MMTHTITGMLAAGILLSSSLTAPLRAQTVTAQLAQADTEDLLPLDQSQPTPAAPVFHFTNVLAYGDCLESILQLFQQPQQLSSRVQQDSCYGDIAQTYGSSGLTRQQALALITAADFYATHLLSGALFPPRGQRIRVAEQFGFLYQVDLNNEQMRSLAAQANAAGL